MTSGEVRSLGSDDDAKLKILIVDDEAIVRSTLGEAMRVWGYRIVEAATVAETFTMVDREQPDAVLLDLKLPDGSGMTALAELRRRSRELVIIIITGYATPDFANLQFRSPSPHCNVGHEHAALRGSLIEVAESQATLEGDPDRLAQALGNLVENALVHGGGPVVLAVETTAGELELHVLDSGLGIAPDFRPRAFDRFSRADPLEFNGGSCRASLCARSLGQPDG